MKFLLNIFIFLLPFHAVAVTFLKCRMGIDTDFLRFWKEIGVLLLLASVSIKVLMQHQWKLSNIFKNNYLTGTAVTFILCSAFYIIFPYLDVRTTSLLGFKYDVFFIFTFLIGLYLATAKEHFESILKTVFVSGAISMIAFLPWYMSGDIANKAEVLGYSKEVSTYEANGCIAFSQNVTGGHNRFQGSFGDPIRFSVFLVVFYFIFLGFTLHKELHNTLKRNILLGAGTILVLMSIFFSFTKTSMLGFLFGAALFAYYVWTIKWKKPLTNTFLGYLGVAIMLPVVYLATFKADLFLHPEAVLGRTDNLAISFEMFYYNPFGYGLGIAGPATQLATSGDRNLSDGVTKFLPENWYVQILLEQGPLGLAIFLGFLGIIITYLYRIVRLKRDYLSIGIFVSFITILFMANFTHIFEEAATSYTLFFIIGTYIAKEYRAFKK